MDKQAFKQRMQNLKSYRENNPGKGYWDWKVQAYQNGGRHALGVGQVFASLANMLFNKERRTPAIAAAAYYTIHQTQNDPVLAPVEAPLVEPIADAIKSVDETPYDPGEVFLLSPENQKKQMTKNPNYRVVDTNSEEDPYGIVRRAANYHKEIHGEVPVYEYIADSDTTIKRSNLIPVGTLPLGEYTPELPHAGSYNSVLYYNASNDKLYQRAYDLNDYGPTDTKDKGASSMYIGPIRWLSRQLDKAGTPFVQRTGFVPLDEGKYYNQLPESAKKKVRERRRLRNSYEYGGEVNEFQRKTRIDPNRQLTPEDISNMRSKGAKIPEQWESLEDADISELTNTFAYNMYQDPVQYMANGGEVGDPDDEFTKAINTKLGRTPDGRPLQQGLKPVFDLEDAANLTPVGDAIAAKDMYNAAMDKDWTGLGLAAATMIPFVPMSVRQFNKTYRGTKRISNKKSPKTSMAEHNISVNPSRMQDLINAAIEKGEKRLGDYNYNINTDITDLNGDITTHEMNHFIDFLKNKSPKADANSPMFYKLSQDIDEANVRLNSNDAYFKLPTEQKAYMNQIREYLFNTGKISKRGDKVSSGLLQKTLEENENRDTK